MKKSTYNLIKKRFFNAIEESDEEHKEAMFILLIFEKEEESSMCEVIEMFPAPDPEVWDEVFEELAKIIYDDMKRVPAYLAIMNQIRYSRMTKEDAKKSNNLMEELDKSSQKGYFMICLEINSGDAVSQLFDIGLTPVEDGDKKFSVFDMEAMKGFMPGIAMTSFVMHILMLDHQNKDKSNLPAFDEMKPVKIMSLSIKRHGKKTEFDIKEDEENEKDKPFSFTDN